MTTTPSTQDIKTYPHNNRSLNNDAVVVFSGGQDSTYCLFWALQRYEKVYPITFNYGQRHKVEIEAAQKVLEIANRLYPNQIQEHEICDVGPILKGTSPLVSDNELEQYEDHQSLPGGLEKTFVPMRNQMFLTLGANRAYVKGCNTLVTGVCQEDNGGYPDCTRQFIDAFEDVSSYGTFTGRDSAPEALMVRTPLMYMDKATTVKASFELPGCYLATAYSHTSYDGQYPPTGHDHATLLRAKGFEEAGIPDPLVIRAYLEGLMDLPMAPNYSNEVVGDYINYLRAQGAGEVEAIA